MSVLALVGAACGGTATRASTPTTGTRPTTTTTPPVPPSTVIGGDTAALQVPFTADDGALTVTVGPYPSEVTAAEAVAIASSLDGTMLGLPPVVDGAPLPGVVDLHAGFGAPAILHRSAWIVPFHFKLLYACPAQIAPLPASASKLRVVIVEGPRPDQIVIYQGAGGGACGGLPKPVTRTSAQL